MLLSIGGIKFIDSLNYFNMTLSSLPKAFDLKSDSVKGTFPFYFNTEKNQNYIGPLPDKKFYGLQNMSVTTKRKFDEWYDELFKSNYIFDFKKEMTDYCKMDVDILREACLKFQKLFMEIGNVCPFSEAVTLAGACSVVYRKNYLKENTIGIIPVSGYRKADEHSLVFIEWYIYEEYKLETDKILHAGRGREYDNYELGVHVDGYGESNGKKYIYQFHGCYFHGHNCLPLNDNEKRYTETLKIDKKIQKSGYELIVIWECEFNKIKT